MAIYRLQSAYLPQGWARDVLVTVSAAGNDQRGRAGAPTQSPTPHTAAIERIDGVVVPGMPNAHSHAFQRAMAGNAEFRLTARDSFWTWRQAMYGLANRIGAGRFADRRDAAVRRDAQIRLYLRCRVSLSASAERRCTSHRRCAAFRLESAVGRDRQRRAHCRHRTHVFADAISEQRLRRCSR